MEGLLRWLSNRWTCDKLRRAHASHVEAFRRLHRALDGSAEPISAQAIGEPRYGRRKEDKPA